MSSSAPLVKKQVLVIGYGGGGSQVTAALAKDRNCKVTVITPFNYQEVMLRMTKVLPAGPAEHEEALYPLVREEGVDYIIDSCTQLTDTSATVSNGSVVNFDICVVATGQYYGMHFTPDILGEVDINSRKAAIAAVSDKMTKANTIVISGGGAVGSELAADTKLRHPSKRVVLVHPYSSLVNKQLPDSHSAYVTKALEKQGVELKLGARVLEYDEKKAKFATHYLYPHSFIKAALSTGETIECECYIPTGSKGGTGGAFMPADAVDEKGYIKVGPTLQVQNHPTIFAFGDCSNFDIKTFGKMKQQLDGIVKNVSALAAGRPVTEHDKTATFFGKLTGPILIALGHDHPGGVGVVTVPWPCPGFLCWCCCCCGGPCSIPAGSSAAKFKSDFNSNMRPIKGKGMTDR